MLIMYDNVDSVELIILMVLMMLIVLIILIVLMMLILLIMLIILIYDTSRLLNNMLNHVETIQYTTCVNKSGKNK